MSFWAALAGVGGAVEGYVEGARAMQDIALQREALRGRRADLIRSTVKDLFDTQTLPELDTKIKGYETAGVGISQETRGKAIVNLTMRDLANQAVSQAVNTDSPDEYRSKMLDAVRYMVKTGDMSVREALGISTMVQKEAMEQRQRAIQQEQASIIRQQLTEAGDAIRSTSGALDDPKLEREAAVSELITRAEGLGVAVSPEVKKVLGKLSLPTLEKLVTKLSSEESFDHVEPILSLQDGPQALRKIAQYLHTPAQAPARVGSAGRSVDTTAKTLETTEQALRSAAMMTPTPEAISQWTKAYTDLQQYHAKTKYTAVLDEWTERGLAQYGQEDPMGIQWSPRARAVMGAQAQIQAMSALLPRLDADPSPAAQDMAQKTRESITKLQSVIKSMIPVDLKPELIEAAQSIFPEHYNATDPVHLVQLLSSPNNVDLLMKRSRQVETTQRQAEAEAAELGKQIASAKVSPNEFQRQVAVATGKPLGSIPTPKDIEATTAYATQFMLDVERQKKEMDRQIAQTTVTSLEEAGRFSLLVGGLDALEELKKSLLSVKNGKVVVDRKKLAAMSADIPWSEGQRLTALATQAWWAQARPESGAQVGLVERQDYIKMYGPRFGDSDQTVISKLNNLENLIRGTIGTRDPSGKLAAQTRSARIKPGSEEARKAAADAIEEAKKQLREKK